MFYWKGQLRGHKACTQSVKWLQRMINDAFDFQSLKEDSLLNVEKVRR